METSAARGGVALLRDTETVAEQSFEAGLVHGREVAPAIKEVTDRAGIPLGDIDLISVDIGPGSYTGVRVGIATAKALAWALGRKLAAVVSLDALAEAAKELGEVIVPVLDARREQLYSATYSSKAGVVTRNAGPAILDLEGFIETAPRPAVLLGDAIARFPEHFPEKKGVTYAAEQFWTPRASVIAELGSRAVLQDCHCEEVAQPLEKGACGPDEAISGVLADPVMLEPLYLRPSEAEQKLGIRVDPSSAQPEKRL
jgi:tRNA threonylcarbamoyladenosine biosynthesis protein TsaB